VKGQTERNTEIKYDKDAC